MFCYEQAQSRIDTFFSGQDPQARHAWMRVRLILHVLAATDYAGFRGDEPISLAWEEFDVALRGYGDELMTGAVMYLWTQVRAHQHASFRVVLREAFRAARDLTAPDHEWLHAEKYRAAKIHNSSEPWTNEIAIPLRGPRLVAWAVREGLDPDRLQELLRAGKERIEQESEEPGPRPPRLRLL